MPELICPTALIVATAVSWCLLMRGAYRWNPPAVEESDVEQEGL